MSERALTVYSAESRDFLDKSSFLLKLDFGDGRDPAHYAVDNMFELEGWERFNPSEVSFRKNAVHVLGQFASLTEMRTRYLEGREQIDDALLEEELLQQRADDVSDFEAEFDKTNDSVKLALHRASIDRVSSLAIENGADEEAVLLARQTAEKDMFATDNPDFRQQIVETHTQIVEQGLWELFGAEEAAWSITELVNWYDLCQNPPYTFYRYWLNDEASLAEEIEDAYHVPRIKVSSELIKAALQELLEDADKYRTASLVDDAVLTEAREIAQAS
jgi:hypothetical protein